MTMKKRTIYVAVSLVLVCVIAIVSAYAYISTNATTTVHFAVASERDDGRTFEVPGTEEGFGDESEEWANLEVNPTYSFGVRFTNVSIPQGAVITEASIRLYSIGLPNRNDQVNCTIYADDVSDALDFYTMGCLNRSGRVYSDAFVLWNEKLPFQQWVSTPTLKYLVQEIVSRGGWKSGNSMAFVFVTRGSSTDSAVFNNYALGNAAELYVTLKT